MKNSAFFHLELLGPLFFVRKGHLIRSSNPKTRSSGFTLIELIVAVTIVGVLAALAAPSFSAMIKNNRLASNINDLTSDLALARSESAKRGHRVTVCASSDGATCTGTWASGRIVFVDLDSDGAVGTGETILRVSPALTGKNTLTFKDITPTSFSYVQYRPKGVINLALNTTFTLCDDRTGNFGRTIDIATTGRATLTTLTACP